ncbi:MAG: putative metal-binding motif-containing protein [Polyangiaceae bacterium]|nr:putative metal-binding motif-containing protein [Polyangiaceae bacterium]
MKAPAVYSFAIVPQATDENGAHFYSKEGSATQAPYLHVEYVVIDGDGDGHPDGPDCDDSNPAVHPGAVELCNGADDDCDGQVEEGCGGGGGADGDATQDPPAGIDVSAGDAQDPAGCAYGRGETSEGARWPIVLAAAGLALGGRLRRRRRGAAIG